MYTGTITAGTGIACCFSTGLSSSVLELAEIYEYEAEIVPFTVRVDSDTPKSVVQGVGRQVLQASAAAPRGGRTRCQFSFEKSSGLLSTVLDV
jgi:hypothetical protein